MAQSSTISEPCTHESASGIDQTPLNDPGKIWRCDSCGYLYLSITRNSGISYTVDACVPLCGAGSRPWWQHEALCRVREPLRQADLRQEAQ